MAQPDVILPVAPESNASRGYDFGPFRLDLASYQLFKDGVCVDLTSKVFDTLAFLLKHRHRVVTKEELLTAVWRDAVVTDDSLVQCISALRRALGDDASKPTYVTTVARRGYRFVAPATEWVEPVESSPVIVPPATQPMMAPPQTSRVSAGAVARAPWAMPLAWLVPVAAVCVFVGWFVGTRLTDPAGEAVAAAGTLRFTQPAPAGTTFNSGGALSPDARRLAFSAEDSTTGRSHLWVRSLDAADARRLDGTEGAARPFWSPDSRFIGFVANGRLKTVSVDGGAPTDVASVGSRPAGAAWGPGGRIIFSSWLSGFSLVSPSGGAVSRLTTLGPGESTHAWPQFLPDGDHFLYSIYGGEKRGITIGRVSTGESTHILSAEPGAIYSPLGYLVFTRNSILTAQAFDAASLTLTGEPFNVVTGTMDMPSMTNGTMFSAAGGLLSMGGARGESELAWFDRSGRHLGALQTPAPLHNPVLSPDGKRVYGNTIPPSPLAVWSVDLERGATSRLVPDASMPVPTPDGAHLAFMAGGAVFSIDLNGSNTTRNEMLARSMDRKTSVQFTRDGQSLLYYAISERGHQDLMLASLTGDRKIQPLLETAANEIHGQLSPDGRWLAYASDESGKWEVFVQSFPEAKSRVTISTAGGAEPQWRADGRELYYLAEDHSLMAVDVVPGATLGLGRPRALFRPRTVGEPTTYRSHYAVSADGQRFLVDVLRDPALDPVTLLVNWTSRR